MNLIFPAGFRIPEDIAVIGAGNVRYAESSLLPLSLIDISRTAPCEQKGWFLTSWIIILGYTPKLYRSGRRSSCGIQASREPEIGSQEPVDEQRTPRGINQDD
jgi:hypothetical protein